MLSRSYFELNLQGVAAPSWTLARDLQGVATSSWTLSRGYFELVLVLAKLLRQCRGPGTTVLCDQYSALRSRLFKVSGEKNFGFCGER